MFVLVACEESQAVTKELRRLGHIAFSCDILECSGGHPEWHIKGDVLAVLNGKCAFTTESGEHYCITGNWDMVIGFPPCTHIANSGAKHFEIKRNDGRQREGIELFMAVMNAETEKLAVENPVNIISGKYVQEHFPDLCDKYGLPIKSTQRIQPWQFGDSFQKTTCLWLKGLPELEYTDVVDPGEFIQLPRGGRMPKWYSDNKSSKNRSKTFPGIAKAMAEQWAGQA